MHVHSLNEGGPSPVPFPLQQNQQGSQAAEAASRSCAEATTLALAEATKEVRAHHNAYYRHLCDWQYTQLPSH